MEQSSFTSEKTLGEEDKKGERKGQEKRLKEEIGEISSFWK